MVSRLSESCSGCTQGTGKSRPLPRVLCSLIPQTRRLRCCGPSHGDSTSTPAPFDNFPRLAAFPRSRDALPAFPAREAVSEASGTDSGDNIPNGWRKSSWMHRRIRCMGHGGHVVWVKSWNERFHESHTAPFALHAVSRGSSSDTFLGPQGQSRPRAPKSCSFQTCH
jgi:hypothetical protein